MPDQKTDKPLITRSRVVIAGVVLGFLVLSVAYPLVLSNSCSGYHRAEPLSQYSFTIKGEVDQAQPKAPHKGSIESTPAPPVSEISANGGARPTDQARDKPETWWTGFWCDQRATDYFLALFTLLLVITGAMQAIFIWAAFRESQSASEIARSAARASDTHVKAMVELERGRMAFGPIGVIRRVNNSHAPLTVGQIAAGEQLILSIPIFNTGRTGLILRSVVVQWVVGNSLPDTPQYTATPSGMNTFIKPDIGWLSQPFVIIAEDHPIGLDVTQVARIQSATDFLYVYGYVEFIDFVGDIYRQGFVAHWEEMATQGRPLGRGLIGDGPLTYVRLTKIGHED